jgi:cytoplasmic iron level regulating protein YaaA (DUF328/UPF0246 family)
MVSTAPSFPLTTPVEIEKAEEIRAYIGTLSIAQIQKAMQISASLALDVENLFRQWSTVENLSAAVEVFRGDIYSGLRARALSSTEKDFAQENLLILSGLYGVLKPFDGISPYRLEVGYRFPDEPFRNLYQFWGDSLSNQLHKTGDIFNVSSVEYEKLILPYIDVQRIITPKFLSVVKPGQPAKFVVVHAKIARGAYTRWLIQKGDGVAAELESF